MPPIRRSLPPVVVAFLVASLLSDGRLRTVAAPPAAPVERVEVRIAQFDVVVRDKAGRIVSGLGPSDFEVVEDGRPLEVVAVDGWGETARPPSASAPTPAAPAPPSEAPPEPAAAERERERRSFVILFDAINGTSALRFTQAKRAARAFVEKNLGPDDLAAVYALDLSLRAQSGFSSDRGELTRAIERIPWMPASNLGDDIAESVLAYRSRAGADYMKERLAQQAVLEGERLDWTREHVYRNLGALGEAFAGLPGRRVLVLVSAGMPMTTLGDIQRERGGFTIAFRELIRTMARSGVTVYSIDIGDDLAFSDPGKLIDWRIAAGKIGMDENALGDLGLDSGMGAGSAAYRRQFLGVIAAETGGRLLTASDLDRAFSTIHEESANFYRLSCRVPERVAEVRYRKIVVRVKRPDASVTARRGRYSDMTPAVARPASASLDSLDRYRSIGMRVAAASLPSADDGTIPVSVVAEVLGPVELAADPQGGVRVELDAFAIARVEGEVVARWERKFSARVKPEGADAVRRAFRLEGRLGLRPGIYELQTTVRTKAPAQFASWTGPLVVQPQARDGALRFAAPLLVSEGVEEPPLLLRADPPATGSDPLTLGEGVRVLPPTSGTLRGDRPILALFWLRGLETPEGAQPKLELDVRARDTAGGAVVPPGRLVAFEPAGAGLHRAVLRLDPSGLAAGAWRLEVTARDGASGRAATIEVPFSIERPTASTSSPQP